VHLVEFVVFEDGEVCPLDEIESLYTKPDELDHLAGTLAGTTSSTDLWATTKSCKEKRKIDLMSLLWTDHVNSILGNIGICITNPATFLVKQFLRCKK